MSTAIRFRDAHGFSWQAVEVGASNVETDVSSLYFFSGGATRRLEHFPDDWSARGWEELDRLRRGATELSADAARHHRGHVRA